MALNVSLTLKGSGSLTGSTDLSTPRNTVTIGSGGFDAIGLILTDGTGNEQANQWWHDERTLATVTGESLDLAGGLTNALGQTVTLTKVKAILIDIDAADGIKALRVGPQNVSNAAQLWFGGVGAEAYETVYDTVVRWNKWAGWAVTAGTGDLLRIYNPSAGSVTYRIWILGVA